jgi:small-conductance mechanosensitive channel
MVDWLLNSGIHILIAVAICGVLIFLILRFEGKITDKLVPDAFQDEIKRSIKILANTISIIVILLLLFSLGLYIAYKSGVDVEPITGTITGWLTEHGIIILIIIAVAFIINKLAKLILPLFIHRFVKVRGKGKSAREEIEKRSSTLSGFIINAITGVVVLLAIFMILSEIGVDIGPLLAGAGVVGIALGFGAQKLIADIINGMFIVLEDYFSKGDVVKIANITGLVEDVNIRRTVLRDLDGIVHIVPNGEINVSSNYTKHWARINLDIPVAYGEDLDRVIAVINRVGMELAEDPKYKTMFITPPQVLRVDNFGDSSIDIKVLGDVKAMKQWDLTGELRKRIKKVFDEEGIEIPWPHTKIYFGNKPGDKS